MLLTQALRLSGFSARRAAVIQGFRGFVTKSPSSEDEPENAQMSWTIVQTRKGYQKTFNIHGSADAGYILSKRVVPEEVAQKGQEGNETIRESINRRIKSFFKSTFLPVGYPSSTGPGYMGYVGWQFITNLAVTTNSVLASTFMLYAVGLGDGAIPTAGALNWVLKDGLGQMGTLIFGKTIAHSFDVHSKTWYFLSMVKLKISTGLEIATILLPEHFLVMGTLANSIKGLAWMANGSTRSVFNLSFARDNNLADLTAKGTSQYICASMFGTVAGASVCSWIGQDATLALTAYGILTAITLVGSYTTVKTIPLATLNNTRLQLLCEAYLERVSAAAAHRHAARDARVGLSVGAQPKRFSTSGHGPGSGSGSGGGSGPEGVMGGAGGGAGGGVGGDGLASASTTAVGGAAEFERAYDEYLDLKVPAPASLSAEDPPLPWLLGDKRVLNPALIMGGLERVLDGSHPELLLVLLSTNRLSKSLVVPRGLTAIHVILHEEAAPRDIVQAYLQACLLRRRMREGESLGAAVAIAEHAATTSDSQPNSVMIPHARMNPGLGPGSGAVGITGSGLPVKQRLSLQPPPVPKPLGPAPPDSCPIPSNGHGKPRHPKTKNKGMSSQSDMSGMHGLHEPCMASSDGMPMFSRHMEDGDEGGPSTSFSPANGAGSPGGGAQATRPSNHGLRGVRREIGVTTTAMAELRITLQDTLQTAERLTSPFMRSLEEAGWRVERIVVEADRRRARW